MIDLVIIHLTHPWGPPWTLATLGEMLENYQFPQKFQISPAFIWDLYMTFATANRTLESSPLGWWYYRKIAISVLNFWWIFGSYHSIHMVGGQEKGFWPQPKTLPIGRLMEQNRWFFTKIGSSPMASEMIADHRNHPQLGRKWKWHPSNIGYLLDQGKSDPGSQKLNNNVSRCEDRMC